MKKTIQVAAVQMVSSTQVSDNIAAMRRLVRQAADAGADWVVLPEYWPIMGRNDTDKVAVAETFGSGEIQAALREAAQENGILLIGGTVPLVCDEVGKVWNTLLAYAPSGECVYRYDKVHLFGYSGLSERYAEADTICSGSVVPHFEYDGWKIGLGICYDIRFPEFFRAQLPFDVLVVPAAFTYTTGKAHWELLLRARAVENQCYVVASGQGGTHESGRRTFGHSLIYDPWGETLACLPEGEGVVVAQMDGTRLNSVRTRLPALGHRRDDLYTG